MARLQAEGARTLTTAGGAALLIMTRNAVQQSDLSHCHSLQLGTKTTRVTNHPLCLFPADHAGIALQGSRSARLHCCGGRAMSARGWPTCRPTRRCCWRSCAVATAPWAICRRVNTCGRPTGSRSACRSPDVRLRVSSTPVTQSQVAMRSTCFRRIHRRRSTPLVAGAIWRRQFSRTAAWRPWRRRWAGQ